MIATPESRASLQVSPLTTLWMPVAVQRAQVARTHPGQLEERGTGSGKAVYVLAGSMR